MTFKEFELKFSKENKQDNNWNYIIASLATIGGIFLLYHLFFTDWYEIKFQEKNGKILSKNIISLAYLILLLLGIYGFWRIPNLYKFTKVKSNLARIENQELIKKSAKEFKMSILKENEEYYHYRYFGKLKNPFDVYFFADENGNILINVQQVDYNGGYIDFGNSNRVKNKIIKEIKNACR